MEADAAMRASAQTAAKGRASNIGVVLSSLTVFASGHSLVPQQRVERRLASTEGLERFHRGPAAAGLQDRLPVFSPGLDAWQAIFVGRLFESRIRVGAQDLRPL